MLTSDGIQKCKGIKEKKKKGVKILLNQTQKYHFHSKYTGAEPQNIIYMLE